MGDKLGWLYHDRGYGSFLKKRIFISEHPQA
jgi:hypothetical protein